MLVSGLHERAGAAANGAASSGGVEGYNGDREAAAVLLGANEWMMEGKGEVKCSSPHAHGYTFAIQAPA